MKCKVCGWKMNRSETRDYAHRRIIRDYSCPAAHVSSVTQVTLMESKAAKKARKAEDAKREAAEKELAAVRKTTQCARPAAAPTPTRRKEAHVNEQAKTKTKDTQYEMPKGYGELAFGKPQSLVLNTMEDAWRLAVLVHRAKMQPAGMETVEAMVIALLYGAEIGLTPMQSLQRIAVIGNRPTIWGDVALALCMNSPFFVDIEETIEGEGDSRTAYCTVTRKGMTPKTSTYSVHNAKTAHLWDDRPMVWRKAKWDSRKGDKVIKAGEWMEIANETPWHTNSDRMLAMRARGFRLRDSFPDVLGGMYVREEFTGTTIEGELAPAPLASSPRVVDNPPPPPGYNGHAGAGEDAPIKDEPPPPPPGPNHINATQVDLLVSAYAADLANVKNEEGCDALWVRMIGPYIDADRLDESVLNKLQELDDEKRGEFHLNDEGDHGR